MSHRYILPVTLAFLLAPLTAHAQEKYTIKLKELAQGDSAQFELNGTTTSKNAKKYNKEKQPSMDEFKGTKLFVYTDTILEKPAGAALPTKVRRVYEKAVQTTANDKVKEERTAAYNGKTLLIEKKGDAYEFRIEGGNVLDAKAAPELVMEFNQNERDKSKKAFLPPGPVALNETWKIDPNRLIGDPDKNVNTEIIKSEGTAKLVKVYKQDGHLFGVIDIMAEFQLRSVFKGNQPGEGATAEMTGTMKITFDGCIDGTLAAGHMKGNLSFNGASTEANAAFTLNTVSTGSNIVDDSWKEVPKK